MDCGLQDPPEEIPRLWAKAEEEFGTFSLIPRKVVDGFLHFRDQDRHYLLILRWLGFDWAAVDYEPAARTAGHSSYSLGRLLRHAMDGVFFQTTILLRWIVYIGFVFSLLGGSPPSVSSWRSSTGRSIPAGRAWP